MKKINKIIKLNIITFIFLFATILIAPTVKAETIDHKFSFTAFTCGDLDDSNKCKGYNNDYDVEEFDYSKLEVEPGEVIKLGVHYTPGELKTWDMSVFFDYNKDLVTPIYVNDTLLIEKGTNLNDNYVIDYNDVTDLSKIGSIVQDSSTIEANRVNITEEGDLYYLYFKVKDDAPLGSKFKFIYDLDEDKTHLENGENITSDEIEFEIIDKYTVTYPDGNVIIKNAGDILKLPETWDKDSETISTVTFKYHNDLEDTTSNVTKEYTLSKWTIDETEYNPGDEIIINKDVVLEDSYEEEIINAKFPENPKKQGYGFDGWYTEETDGEKVVSLDGIITNTTLHAHYRELIEAYLITGPSINTRIDRYNTTAFRKATLEEYNAATLTEDNIISTDDSPSVVYMWNTTIDSEVVTLYYTEADIMYMNEDSSQMFSGCSLLEELDLSNFDTRNVTSMSNMFSNMYKLQKLDLSNFDTSNVTNMEGMFSSLYSLNELNVSSFDTSNVIYMRNMFSEVGPIKNFDISNFNTSSVTQMESMFRGSDIEKIDLSNFDISHVTSLSGLFEYSDVKEIDVSNWDTDHITNMGFMFSKCKYLTTIYASKDWTNARLSNSTSNEKFFSTSRKLMGYVTPYDENKVGQSMAKIDDPENGKVGYFTDVSHKGETHSVTFPDGTVELYSHNSILYLDKNETTNGSYYSGEITFKYHNGQPDSTAAQRIDYVGDGFNCDDIHYDDYGEIRINSDKILGYDYKPDVTEPILPDAEKEGYAFVGWYTEEEGGEKVTKYLGDEPITLHAHYDDIKTYLINGYSFADRIKSLSNYSENLNSFRKATEEEYNLAKDNLNDDNIVSTEESTAPAYMWYDGENILYYSKSPIINMNSDCNSMFYETSFASIDLSGLDSSNVTDMGYMFNNCSRLTELDISNLNTSNVTSMDSMFSNCSSLEELDLSNFDTRKVSQMSSMFAFDSNLVELNLSGFNITNVYNINYMFQGCSSLEELDISSFDTSNTFYANDIFSNDAKLKTIYVSELFDNSNFDSYSTSFTDDTKLVGGAGTTFDSEQVYSNYARIDDPDNGKPGYFTYKEFRPTIYYPDGTSQEVDLFYELELPNSWPKDGIDYTITYKYNDGVTDDSTSTITKSFELIKWDVNYSEYDLNSTVVIKQNTYLEPIYDETVQEAVFPETPKRLGYKFDGWYTEEEGGEKVESYSEAADIVLYAHWIEATQTITTPDGEEEVPYGTEYTLGTNDTPKDDTTNDVTFKYHDDTTDDLVKQVTKTYTPNGWLVNDVHYADEASFEVTEDVTIEPDYIEVVIPVEFPSEPVREHYEFDGWYTEETGGEKIESYSLDEDITLHAHWIGETQTITTPDGEEEVPYGTEYTLGTNDTPKEDDTYTVTFKYHDDVTGDLEKTVTVQFTPNGWLVNDVHYDDEASFEVIEDITIEPDYIEVVIPVEFPSEPTRDNYEFLGWYTEETGGEKIESYSLEADKTLHAQWKITLPTDITIDSDDVTIVVGETHQVVVTFTPEGATDTLTYTGYDNEIISVTDGLVTGLTPGETTITIGTENTDITKEITVTVLSDKLESDVYSVTDKVRPKENEEDPDITDRIVIGAEDGTYISEFKDNMLNPNEYIKIYDKDGNEVEDSEIVRTGLTIKLEYNGIVLDEASMVVRGDVDGDGFVNVSDYISVLNHALSLETVDDYISFAAGDVEEDNMLNVSDYIKIMDYALRNIDSIND